LKRFWNKHRRPAASWDSLRRVKPLSGNYGIDRGQPIDRYYIESFMDEHRRDIQGRVLEIQTDGYTKKFGGSKVTRRDVLDIDPKNRAATFIDDLQTMHSVPSDSFDCAVVTQTLQYVYDIRSAVRNLFRILKPGGVLLSALPSVTRVDPGLKDTDYWRVTEVSTRRILEGYFSKNNIEIVTYGNVLTNMMFLMGLASHELAKHELDHRDANFPLVICVRAVK